MKPAKKSFAQRVAAVVRDLRRGEVVSYREVARRAGYPAAARAVGNVLASSVGLPWWRVIRADGSFAAHNSGEQAARLRREGVVVREGRVTSPVARSGNFLTSVSPRVYSSHGQSRARVAGGRGWPKEGSSDGISINPGWCWSTPLDRAAGPLVIQLVCRRTGTQHIRAGDDDLCAQR